MTSGPRLTLDDAQRLSARRQQQIGGALINCTNKQQRGDSSSGSDTSGKKKRRRPRNIKKQVCDVSPLPRLHPNRYVALDCEMVGVGPEGTRSALARVSMVDYKGEVVFDTFVKVYEKVTDYRTHISGIRPGDLESPDALCPTEVYPLVYRLLQNKILIGHGLENDLKLLGVPVDRLKVRDTAWYPPFMRLGGGCLCPRKLRDLSKDYLGLDIQGQQHDSVTDARTALCLFKLVEGEWERDVMQLQCQQMVVLPQIAATMAPAKPNTSGVALLA
jgi:RNA exonuclease 4